MAIMTKEPRSPHEHPGHPLKARLTHHNVGGWERAARLFVGAVAAGASVAVGAVWLKAVLGALGLAGLATSVGGYCPVNRAIGRDSYHRPPL